METDSFSSVSSAFSPRRAKSKTLNRSVSSIHKLPAPTPEELKETIEKSKEYLKNNKNINCYYLLNRTWKSIQDNEIDIHSRFQLCRSFVECINRIINRIFVKHPEKNEKQFTKVNILMEKALIVLDEWSNYNLVYINEYKENYSNKQNEKIMQDLLEDLPPWILADRDIVFDLKVIDDSKEENKEPPSPSKPKDQVKKEESLMNSIIKGSTKNILPKVKYRKLTHQDKPQFINFEFYFTKFWQSLFQTSFLFAFFQKKKKNHPLAVLTLKNLSERILLLGDYTQDNPAILDIYLRSQMLLASIFWENGILKETLDIYDGLVEFHKRHFALISVKELVYRKKGALNQYKKKLNDVVRKMSLNFLMQSILYEFLEAYERAMECTNFSTWMASSFLEDKDEVLKIIMGISVESHSRYDGILLEYGEINKVIKLYLDKFYKQHPEKKPEEKPVDIQLSILQESDRLLYEKFKKKLEGFEYVFVKSFSEPQTSDSMNSNVRNNDSKINDKEKLQKTQDKTQLFEVSLEPSFREQSLTSKRLSALGMLSSRVNDQRKEQDTSLDISRDDLKTSYRIRDKSQSVHVDGNKRREKRKEEDEETFPGRSTILTTMKYFKTSKEIKKLVESRHNKTNFSELGKIPTQEMHNLDDFFAKKINSILLRKCQNRPITAVQSTFDDFTKEEDFDKKEFDFTKKMLRHKKSYSMGRIKSEYLISKDEKDQINWVHPRWEIRKEIKELLTKNNIIETIDRTKLAQEDEKTSNFCSQLYQRSSIVTGMGSMNSLNDPPGSKPQPLQNIQSPIEQGQNSEEQKGKLRSLIMKHRVTFEFQKRTDMENRESIEKKGVQKMKSTMKRTSKSFHESGKEQAEFYHQSTKETIQRMAENLVKEMEQNEKTMSVLRGENQRMDERKLANREKEVRAKMMHIVKKNGELSRSTKNILKKREVLENFQSHINALTSQKMASNFNLRQVMQRVQISSSEKIY